MTQATMNFMRAGNARTCNRLWQLWIKNVEAPGLLSSTNNPLCQKILKQTITRKNEILQLSVRVSLLTKIKLKEKCGKLRTEVKGMRGVGLIVPDPRIHDLDP